MQNILELILTDPDFLMLKKQVQPPRTTKKYTAHTLPIGKDSIVDDKEFLAFYGKQLYTADINGNTIQIYEGTGGNYLGFFSISHTASTHQIRTSLDDIAQDILNVPYIALKGGYLCNDGELTELNKRYLAIAQDVCKKFGLVSVGDNILHLEF